jgi:hypothetical protein
MIIYGHFCPGILSVLSNFVEMCPVWNWAHFDEDYETCPNMAYYGILWPAVHKDGQLWLWTSRLSYGITVSAVPANSFNEYELWEFRAHRPKHNIIFFSILYAVSSYHDERISMVRGQRLFTNFLEPWSDV